jgi:TRAP-type C4-dicarboxylate transport system permease small subunit
MADGNKEQFMLFLKKVYLHLNKVLTFVCARIGDLATIIIIPMGVLIVLAIILRRFFNSPLTFSYEIVQLSFSLIVFSAIAFTTSVGRHISIDVLTSRFSASYQRIVLICTDSLSAILFGLIGWRNIVHGVRVWERGSVTGILEIPYYPFYFFAAFCCILAGLAILSSIIKSFIREA